MSMSQTGSPGIRLAMPADRVSGVTGRTLSVRCDVSDWLQLGHTVDELVALANATPPWRDTGLDEVTSPMLSEGWVLRLEGDSLVERSERPTAVGRLLSDFFALLRTRPFPFRSCPACNRIFVRVKRQLYCSPRCGAQVLETARKDSKREYMRQYMAGWRARKHAARRQLPAATLKRPPRGRTREGD
jgi:hypothetical protein